MSWIILTILSAIFGSIARILQKVLLTDKDSDPFAFSFVFQLVVALMFLAHTLLTNTFQAPNLSGLTINLIVMTVFYSLGNIYTFKAFQIADASEVSVILASSSVWAVMSALVLLDETLTIQNILGIILIVLGVVSINYTKSKWQFNKGHLFGLLGAMLFGIAFTNDAYIINRYQSISSYMVLAFTLPGLMTLFLKPASIKIIPNYLRINVLGKMFVCTSVYALSALTIFSAYKQGGPASIISPLQQLNIILTVILGYVFLRERDKLTNKIIGTVLAFAGAILLI